MNIVLNDCDHVHFLNSSISSQLKDFLVMATSSPTAVPKPQRSASPNTLIPEKYLDVPSQRLYYLSLGLLCQVSFIFVKGQNLVT